MSLEVLWRLLHWISKFHITRCVFRFLPFLSYIYLPAQKKSTPTSLHFWVPPRHNDKRPTRHSLKSQPQSPPPPLHSFIIMIELTTINLHALTGEYDQFPKPAQLDDLDHHLPISSLTAFGAWNLYLSHALSTWNGRTYEFGAVSFFFPFIPFPVFPSPFRDRQTNALPSCKIIASQT